MAPLASVVVTVFNRHAFLTDALQSVLDSTFEDFELIVVDDASSDGSFDLARDITAHDRRVQVYRNEKNLGDYPNRMRAASFARGRYIKYVDSDDIIYPHSLAVMVDGMERYPDAALGLVHSNPEDESPYPWCLSPEEAYRKHFLARGCLSCGPSGAIIRREAFEAIGGFEPKWGVLSDSDLWYRLAAGWPTVLLPPGLVWWRRHEQQEFSRDDAKIVYIKRGYELSNAALSGMECPLPLVERGAALQHARQHFARRVWSLALRDRRPRQAFRMFKESNLTTSQLISGLRAYQ
jgi:glycosyltransferase involved in cell wall biosynthesis